jgi:hypothetical protein
MKLAPNSLSLRSFPLLLGLAGMTCANDVRADDWVVNSAALPKPKDAIAEWRPDPNGKRAPLTRPANRATETAPSSESVPAAEPRPTQPRPKAEAKSPAPSPSEPAPASKRAPSKRPRTVSGVAAQDARLVVLATEFSVDAASKAATILIRTRKTGASAELSQAQVKHAGGQITLALPLAAAQQANLLLPLDTSFFDTPVEKVQLVRSEGGLSLQVALKREASAVLEAQGDSGGEQVFALKVTPQKR